MSVSYYDSAIKPHLTAAHEYAYRAAREISRMPKRPAFFTLAQDELDNAEAEAAAILEVIRSVKASYASKPLETA